MFLDSTAIAAILLNDDEGDYLLGRLENHKDNVLTSPLSVVEAVNCITARHGRREEAFQVVMKFLTTLKCQQIAFTGVLAEKVVNAQGTFGIGVSEALAYVCVQRIGWSC